MSRRFTSSPLDLSTNDPRSGLCRYCGRPLPAREPRRGRPTVTCSPECKRRYTNRQKWEARIQNARRATRLTHDRSDGTLPWAASYEDVATYDDEADAMTMAGYVFESGALDLLHGFKLKNAVNRVEQCGFEELDKYLEEIYGDGPDGLQAFLVETGQELDEHAAEAASE